MKTLKKTRFVRIAVMALVLCSALSLAAIGVQAESVAPASDPSPAAYVAEKNADSVVGILTYADGWSPQTGVQSSNIAQGSGVVIREGGYVLTNNHVIASGSSYEVLTPSGEKVEAELVGADSALDLAVLKVTGEHEGELTPVEFGSVDDLAVGSTVVAIGNPGGEVLANTVTQGIVSALERSSVEAQGATRTVAYIQHDAAINSGNSGGGLFDYQGRLIGINTLKYAGSAYSSVTFEGLGFAIPVETVIDISNDLIEHGKVIRPALGVQVAAYAGPDEPLGSYPPASVCIYAVNEGGAAEAAGLQAYDFIYAINGQRVTTLTELTTQMDMHEPDDVVDVTVIRYKNAAPVTQTGSYNPFSINPNDQNGSSSAAASAVAVSGGFEEITVQLTLEELK